ncbi:MAG: cytochrome C oxidase subunit III [Sulfurimonas sp. RIFOXYD12_FULL_33_39]|uniref:c-type cytochrome n=1 Tax=unclassified Sulfurimonas TaxID=2623549 RepID=UPI0008AD3C36|nr:MULTISPECIES: c-type cytochrome [unclassified Sulfurimonas]OHE05362.1 MAG: cytochrome C oxidase subunit III [Sulfurimonas sp. RIFCSPLOWO2_12_FULL_34_6]OHE09836.1 MAG: cytochrome C oxidase subunit III [Sulfurimonas sp. RIFOXYD12_FULL_33_39]OHE13656.1 MAG: cytochrome C oxidase subunit III [Sulfurimonas sp. RIFOXYD2_FULL_34_21]DAB27707.1 MAG TPA: cytochrome C oxidase subunit III [Sulfurimonas sp. UBA10385]
MNKLYLWGIIFTAFMLLLTYLSVGGSEGGLNGDIVNMLAVTGAIALVVITVFVVIKYVRQMQVDSASGELAQDNWDGIGEYLNEVPTGWAVMFFLLIVWGMWYFTIGYPLNAYSQIGEYNEDVAVHNAKFETQYKDIKGEKLVEMGESVFLAECKVCHGINADGIDGKAANLNKRIEAVAIKHAIANGANNMKTDFPGGMPPMMLSDPAQIDAVVGYITSGFPEGHKGAEAFAMGGCTGCHGEKGEGMPFVGPKLNGFDVATVASILKDGKKGAIGTMPKFEKLNDKQKEAVGAYITSLSK